MSTYKGIDDATDLLLDFISEGESGGNYNAVIGNAKATDDLSLKNLLGIEDLMTTLQVRGEPSTAVGRYQIIRGTLTTLCGELNLKLPNTTMFTETLQDRLAVQLLIGRGYVSWWRGAISDATFAHGLSCEWASLPDPRNDGKSHYDGIGANHASATLDAVYNTLRAARTLIGAMAQTPAHAPAPASA